jgi:polyphosphate kinase
MERNLDRRVEILFPILDPAITQTLRDEILGTYQADNVKARYLRPDGSYAWLSAGDAPVVNSQHRLLDSRALSAL